MALDIAPNIISGVVGGFIALVLNKFLDRPFIKISKVSQPFLIGGISTDEFGEDTEYLCHAYRLEIINEGKFIFGESAHKCRCEINIDGSADTFRLPWLYFDKEAEINCRSIGEIDFCGRCTDDSIWKRGSIISPLNNGYQSAKKIGNGDKPITGKIRITSENGGHINKKFTISPIGDDNLQITFS